jgi:hypothetical protein
MGESGFGLPLEKTTPDEDGPQAKLKTYILSSLLYP